MGGALHHARSRYRSALRSADHVPFLELLWCSTVCAMAEPELPGVVLNQEYRVKLGKSFTFPKENAFHTIKCKECSI